MVKNKWLKKAISIIAASAMLVALVPAVGEAQEVSAVGESVVETKEAGNGDYDYFLVEDGTICITDYIGTDTEVVIPDTIEGYRVMRIGAYAFDGCSNLTKVEIPGSVTEIGRGAFEDCSSLTEVKIPEGVTKIGEYAFRYCESLTEVKIPEGATEIGVGAFDGCSSLKSIWVDEKNRTYTSYDGCLYTKEPKILHSVPGGKTNINYPEGVTEIGAYAFGECYRLTEVKIPEGVTKIGAHAFKGCESLTEVKIPGSVTEIGDGAFSDCYSLKSIWVDEKNSAYTSYDGCLYTKELTRLCSVPGGKTNINYPEGMMEIADSAIRGCISLTEVEIPEGVTKIGEYAFRHCESLTEVKIPGSVTEIGDDAFINCYSMKRIIMKGNAPSVTSFGFLAIPIIYVPENAVGYDVEPWTDYEIIYGEPSQGENPFTDVKADNWYYDSVIYVKDKGLMTGIDPTTFAPEQPLARAQFAVILHRINGEPKMEYTDRFKDVPEGEWYTDAVLWAASNGIVNGYEDTGLFGTADNINREQMAVMMYRYAKQKGYDISKQADFSKFADAASVSGFASDAMKWAVGNEIIKGKNGTMLDPQGNATRAECATIMMRFVKKYEE